MAIQLKIGDVVHVRGTVVKTLDREVGLDVGNIVGGVPHYFWIPSGCVVHVEPPAIKVGEVVRHQSRDWIVLSIDGDVFWIKNKTQDCYASVLRDEIQRYS